MKCSRRPTARTTRMARASPLVSSTNRLAIAAMSTSPAMAATR